ncbi:hypothetical protein BD413DRAFT_486210 [Trametes elegans]|nr:hypothetical protein BD413DRAFT_486210 [Trametes elegans]
MSTFYHWQLALLVLVCAISFVLERHVLRKDAAPGRGGEGHGFSSVVSKLSRHYLSVYAIVMAADWLQGPYIYSLYREQHALPERFVALLFVLGFLTAGISAPAVGVWADQYGRKRMCLVFCVTYSLACVAIQYPYLAILFLGRLLGGFSTAILFSCFESWLISSANGLSLSSRDLSAILGHASLVNSVVATLAGIASNQLVARTELFSSPFVASGVLLLSALVVIWFTWDENFGGENATAPSVYDIFSVRRLSEAWSLIYADSRLLVLGLTQTCFEGSMYLFVFLWVPFLQEVVPDTAGLPLGYIFSSFMLSMTLGAILYTSVLSSSESATSTDATSDDRTVEHHAKLSAGVCMAGAAAFLLSVASKDEHLRFWAFCSFEACVGVYYPVQGMLRGKLVPDEHRATLSSLFRVPLNVFVVVSLLTGVSSARQLVLSACALLLVISASVTTVVFFGRAGVPSLASLRVQ